MPETNNHTDFFAEISSDDCFYIEAIHYTGKSRKEAGQERITNTIYDELNRRINSTDFFINFKIDGKPVSQPPHSIYTPALQQFIDSQDYIAVRQAFIDEKYDELPCHVYEQEDLRIEFSLIPKSEASRAKSNTRNIGITEEWDSRDHHTILRDKIHKKGIKYGRLNKPFIIAINHLHTVDRIDIEQALFGDEQYFLNTSSNRATNNSDLVFQRRLNGLWIGNEGHKYTRVTGVLVVCGLTPWVTSEASICLYQNPFAEFPYTSKLSRLPQAVVRNNQICYEEGEPLRSLLDMNEVADSCPPYPV